MNEISIEEAKLLGVETIHNVMENGEKRFRLVNQDGSSYIRTESSTIGAWQNSHYHKHLNEIYIVESGWIVYAELAESGELTLKYLKSGEMVSVMPLKPHNIYMSPSTVTHVIKYGCRTVEKPDWFHSQELDRLIKPIAEKELIKMIETRIDK
ncbi:hypothetical protein [Paenibacillus bovis]|uniref:Cupin 2 conserved barrel domain-containing protein n=1 Tax=Paenibacillus bovis TaxID=1616788 RepID=A0A172ZBP3_9BACL|nr:hypothetical protein [Paenibacillus bovis]ANF94792.1 hypothetical protein AR543_01250 [Paenibacillus bovis]